MDVATFGNHTELLAFQNHPSYKGIAEILADKNPVDIRKTQMKINEVAYIREVKQMGDQIKLTMHENAKVDTSKISEILAAYPNELQFKVEASPYFIYRPRKRKTKETVSMMEKTEELLRKMQCLV